MNPPPLIVKRAKGRDATARPRPKTGPLMEGVVNVNYESDVKMVDVLGGSVDIGKEFWSRISQIGRLRQVSITGIDLGVAGTWENITGTQVIVSPGYNYLIQEVHFSTNVDCEVALRMNKGYRVFDLPLNAQENNVNQYTTGFYGSFIKAFTPFTLKFHGEEWVDGDIVGLLILQSRGTVAGKFTGYVKGWEVAKNA